MLRFAARALGFWLLAAAIVAGVVDGAKTIAASALVVTPLSETWGMIAAAAERGRPAATEPFVAPWPLDLLLAFLLAAPTVIVLAGPGVALLVLGAKRRPPSLSREFAA